MVAVHNGKSPRAEALMDDTGSGFTGIEIEEAQGKGIEGRAIEERPSGRTTPGVKGLSTGLSGPHLRLTAFFLFDRNPRSISFIRKKGEVSA
jgi:hypothetical protein